LGRDAGLSDADTLFLIMVRFSARRQSVIDETRSLRVREDISDTGMPGFLSSILFGPLIDPYRIRSFLRTAPRVPKTANRRDEKTELPSRSPLSDLPELSVLPVVPSLPTQAGPFLGFGLAFSSSERRENSARLCAEKGRGITCLDRGRQSRVLVSMRLSSGMCLSVSLLGLAVLRGGSVIAGTYSVVRSSLQTGLVRGKVAGRPPRAPPERASGLRRSASSPASSSASFRCSSGPALSAFLLARLRRWTLARGPVLSPVFAMAGALLPIASAAPFRSSSLSPVGWPFLPCGPMRPLGAVPVSSFPTGRFHPGGFRVGRAGRTPPALPVPHPPATRG
jgi:hypothetical protein